MESATWVSGIRERGEPMVAERKYVTAPCPTCEGHGLIQFEEPQAAEGREVQQILVDIAVAHGVTIGDLVGPSRVKAVSEARQEAMYRIRQRDVTLKATGWYLGKRDHSTVLHGIKVHCERNGLQPPAVNGW